MREIEIVDRIAKWSRAVSRRELILGVGDDCAVFRANPSEDLLFTTDQMIEGVHFLAASNPAAIGERALARSLSDIAAMGGSPRLCLISLAVPSNNPQWIDGFYRGV